MTATQSQLDTPPAGRLVIRVKLVAREPPPPAARRVNKTALLWIFGVIAVLLGWLALSLFKPDAPPPVAASKRPVPEAVVATAPAPVEPEVQQQPDPPLSPVNEVLPDVPKSALDTIRGTVRVAVRVDIDKQGSVTGTNAEERGPSRYFERLAVDASKKWTFTPATLAEKRTMLLKFYFTRFGARAEAAR